MIRGVQIKGKTESVSSEYAERLTLPYSAKLWIRLALAVVVITPLSLGVHEIMLEGLRVPHPPRLHLPAWAPCLNALSVVTGLGLICRFADTRIPLRRLLRLLGLAVVMLNETLRVYFIDVALCKAWLFQGVTAVPNALYLFLLACTVVIVSRRARRNWNFAGLLMTIAVAFPLLVRPALDRVMIPVLRSLARFDYPQLYFEPYPLKIFVPIYAGYLEPVLATFLVAWMVWPAMRVLKWQRVLLFSIIILLLKGSIINLLVWSFWIPGSLAMGMLSEGQFTMEVLVLGLLTGSAWEWLRSNVLVDQHSGE